MKRRDANLVLITLAAVGGGVVVYSFPVDLLEMGIRVSGLASIVPAALPPLGETARAVSVVVGGLGASAITALFLPWKRRGHAGGKLENDFAVAEGFTVPDFDLDLIPAVRRSDAHPDAPPRPPLFASRDLGGQDRLPPAARPEREHLAMRPIDGPHDPIVRDITGMSTPHAPEPLPWETIQQEMSRLLAGVQFRAVAEEKDRPSVGLAQPTISELTERLERGLARRRALREAVASPEGAGIPSFPGEVPHTPQPAADEVAPREEGPSEAGSMIPAPDGSGMSSALAALRGIIARTG